MKCKLFGMGLGLLFHLSFMFLQKKLGGNIIYLLTSMKDKKNADELIIYHQSIRMGLIIIPLSLGSFSQPTII
jgi:hypothetical protein